jgi:hypothetical protein
MSWPEFVRDAHGTIVLEEVDEDEATAVYRVHGRRSVSVQDGGGADGEVPAALAEALDPPACSRFVAASGWR